MNTYGMTNDHQPHVGLAGLVERTSHELYILSRGVGKSSRKICVCVQSTSDVYLDTKEILASLTNERVYIGRKKVATSC